MNPVRDAAYWAKRLLLGIYGPATQDPDTDPVEQLKREHGDPDAQFPEPDDAASAGADQAAANSGDQPDADPPAALAR